MAKNNQKNTSATKEQKEQARLNAYADRILKEVAYYEEINRERYSFAWA